LGRQFRSLELVRSGLPRTLLVSRATWAPPMPISPPSDGLPLAFLCLHTGPSRHPLCPAGSPRRVSPSLDRAPASLRLLLSPRAQLPGDPPVALLCVCESFRAEATPNAAEERSLLRTSRGAATMPCGSAPVDGPPGALCTTGGHAGASRLALCTTGPAVMRRGRGGGAGISAAGRARAPCRPAGSKRARRTRMHGRCWSSRSCTQPRANDPKIACRACEGGGSVRRTIGAWRRWARSNRQTCGRSCKCTGSHNSGPKYAPAVAPVWPPAPTRPGLARTRARHAAGGESLQETCETAALGPTGGAGARACPRRPLPRRLLLHQRCRAWRTTASQRQRQRPPWLRMPWRLRRVRGASPCKPSWNATSSSTPPTPNYRFARHERWA
jgi:hypothetical protein